MNTKPLSAECLECGVYLDGDDACRPCRTWIAATLPPAAAERLRRDAQVDILVEHLAQRKLRRLPVVCEAAD